MIHFVHRSMAAICGILILIISLQKNNLFLLFVLSIQIILGVLNVIYLLPIYLAVLHNLFASLLLLTFIKAYYDNKRLHQHM
jgi:cytochrome c oxidase assembly protein subunit 15